MNAARNRAVKKIKSLCYLTLGGSVAYQFIYLKKDFNGYYDSVLQPISQTINPEWSHKIGVLAIKYGMFPTQNFEDPKVLVSGNHLKFYGLNTTEKVEVIPQCISLYDTSIASKNTKILNTELSNPIGIAAGFDKHGDAVIGLKNVGFSIVEIGSVTPEAQPGNPKPRVFRLPEDKAVINRYGFNSEGHDQVYNKIKNLDKTLLNKSILGINLGKNKLSNDPIKDYSLGIHKFWDVADYFVINISSPNTPGLRSLQGKEELSKLLTEINKVRNAMLPQKNTPFLLKLAPDLSEQEKKDIVAVINKKESKVDGLIISNTTVDRQGLVHQDLSKETGGLSGKPLANKSTEMIKEMYKLTKGKIPIIGVGGVFTGQDAYEKILAGASAVQIYTALIYHGPPVIGKIKQELADLLLKNGYSNVNDAVGKGVK